MDVLIDTNVIVGYYKEDVLEFTPGLVADHDPQQTGLTGSVIDLFDRFILHQNVIILDENDRILTEWRSHIPRLAQEWFNEWYIKFLQSGLIMPIPVDQNQSTSLLQRLYRQGFPNSVDKWYIRIAKSRAVSHRIANRDLIVVNLVSEDIDFFDPSQKNTARGQARFDILMSEDPPIARITRSEGIDISCVGTY